MPDVITPTITTLVSPDSKKAFAKIYNPVSNKNQPAKLAFKITSNLVKLKNTSHLHQLIISCADQKQALVTGQYDPQLANEPRRGKIPKNQPVTVLVLDLDKVPVPDLLSFFTSLPEDHPLNQTQCIWQPSASAYLQTSNPSNPSNPSLSGHLLYLLDRPTSPQAIKSFLLDLNLTTPAFADNITLGESGQYLHYPVDLAPASPSQLIYVAPPINHPLSNTPNSDKPSHLQIKLIQGSESHTQPLFPSQAIADTPNPEILDQNKNEILVKLRKAKGYKKHNLPKINKSTGIMTNPEPGRIHEVSEDDYHIRCNLNSGDSDSYWIFKNNPTLIHTFKDEPARNIVDIDPEYYETLVNRLKKVEDKRRQEDIITTPDDLTVLGDLYKRDKLGRIVFPFVEQDIGRDYLCIIDQSDPSNPTGLLPLNQASIKLLPQESLERTNNLMKSYGRGVMDRLDLPRWGIRFEPHSYQRVDYQDEENRMFNQFNPSQLLKQYPVSCYHGPEHAPIPELANLAFRNFAEELYNHCPLIFTIVHNAVGGAPLMTRQPVSASGSSASGSSYTFPDFQSLNPDPEELITTNYLINWLSFILQTRKKTKTAWLLQGIGGTGKSVLTEGILAPLLGNDHAILVEFDAMATKFDSWLQHVVVCSLDEAQTDKNTLVKVQSKLKTLITQSEVSLEAKYAHREVGQTNYINFIINTNKHGAVLMESGEMRRINVGKYQVRSLPKTPDDPMGVYPFNLKTFEPIVELPKELEQFTKFMLSLPSTSSNNLYKVYTAHDNEAKRLMQSLSTSHTAQFAKYILQGDLQKMLELMPTPEELEHNVVNPHLRIQYSKKLEQVHKFLIGYLHTHTDEPQWVSVVDIYTMFELTRWQDEKLPRKQSFYKAMTHHQLYKHPNKQLIKSPHRRGKSTVFSTKIQFKANLEFITLIRQLMTNTITTSDQAILAKQELKYKS